MDYFDEAADYKIDLFKFPWAFDDHSVDAMAMFHFLEHVEELEKTVQEVHRILKKGGEFWVVVPHARNSAAYDISHRWMFTSTTFATIAERKCYRFGGKQIFQTTSFKMPIINSKWVKWTPLDWISAKFPVFYEKFIPIAPAHIEWKGIAL